MRRSTKMPTFLYVDGKIRIVLFSSARRNLRKVSFRQRIRAPNANEKHESSKLSPAAVCPSVYKALLSTAISVSQHLAAKQLFYTLYRSNSRQPCKGHQEAPRP